MDIQTLNETIINCRRCPRLVEYREMVASTKKKAYQNWNYWGRPVTALGDFAGRVMVVGLAPGAHGSNRTGRVFTGDASGVFLFRALHKAGFANQIESIHKGDGLKLSDMLITAVCRCAPPNNKPDKAEISNCMDYLEVEIELMKNLQGYVALGRIAFDNLLSLYRARGITIPKYEFRHGGFYPLGEGLPWLIASYHPSQQNTLTGKLTTEMFDDIWKDVRMRLR